jgi:hypothetical protein
MKTTIRKVRVNFGGIYAWGDGFVDHKYRLWHLYWSKVNGIFWHTLTKYEEGQISIYLVSLYGSAYVHPDRIDFVMEKGNSNYALDELKDICKRCAEECGGTMKMYVSEKEVDFEEEKEWN